MSYQKSFKEIKNFDFMLEIFGILGGIIIIVSWFPQIFKIIKNESSKDVSFGFLFVILLGTIFLLIYSIYIKDKIYTTINSLVALDIIILLIIAYKYRKI